MQRFACAPQCSVGFLALVAVLSCVACTGVLEGDPGVARGVAGAGGPPQGPSGGPGAAACGTPDVSPSVLRRLSRVEYQLTLQDLFQLPEPPAVDRVPDDSSSGGFRTIAAYQDVSDQHLRAYLETAESHGRALLQDAARRDAVLGCQVDAPDCLAGFVERFGGLAFRRHLEPAEVSALVQKAQAAALDVQDQFQFAIESLLTSPSFLFRVEVGDGAAVSALSPSELAARLSFTLWGRGPSQSLLDRANAGELATPAALATTAREMLADARAKTFFEPFFKQWLGFEQLRAPNVPPPEFDEAMLPEMVSETELLLNEFAWSPATSLLDVLTTNATYLSPALGTFYGVPHSGAGFERIELPASHPRANTGLLTHASLISAKNDGDLISVRGQWLRSTFLCEDLHVPSDLLDDIQGELAGLSYLEVVAKRNSAPTCAGCHALIDPIGVGFAQYDAIGHYDPSVRIEEFGLEQRFEGATEPAFASLDELAHKLKASPQVAECVAKKLFIYTQGREAAAADGCTVRDAGQRFAASGHGFSALIEAFVTSPNFGLRRIR